MSSGRPGLGRRPDLEEVDARRRRPRRARRRPSGVYASRSGPFASTIGKTLRPSSSVVPYGSRRVVAPSAGLHHDQRQRGQHRERPTPWCKRTPFRRGQVSRTSGASPARARPPSTRARARGGVRRADRATGADRHGDPGPAQRRAQEQRGARRVPAGGDHHHLARAHLPRDGGDPDGVPGRVAGERVARRARPRGPFQAARISSASPESTTVHVPSTSVSACASRRAQTACRPACGPRVPEHRDEPRHGSGLTAIVTRLTAQTRPSSSLRSTSQIHVVRPRWRGPRLRVDRAAADRAQERGVVRHPEPDHAVGEDAERRPVGGERLRDRRVDAAVDDPGRLPVLVLHEHAAAHELRRSSSSSSSP